MRLRLRGRLALQMLLIVGVAGALVALAESWIVRGTLERSARDELDRLAERAREDVVERTDRLRADLARIEAALRAEPDLLERWLAADPTRRLSRPDAARRFAEPAGLAALSVLDPDGIVLAASHAPQRAGLPSPLAGTAGSALRIVDVDAGNGRFAALAASRTVTAGSRTITLVGAIDLAGLQRRDARSFVALETERGGGPGPAAPEGWLTRAQALDEPPGLRLVVGLDGAGWRARAREALWVGVGVALLAALLAAAAGAWAAGTVTRPVADLVRAVERIRRGEADYALPAPSGHELEELAAAFSRLQRSLESQQRRARAAERVAAWREVARRIAHEVKNPLAPIRLTMQNLIKARGRSRETFEVLFDDGARTVLEEVERLSRLVTEFSEFARMPLPRPEFVEPDAIVERVVQLHHGVPGIRFDRASGLGAGRQAPLDVDQLSRALTNLIGNAVEALDGQGGTVTVRTADCGDHFTVAVEDDGPGFGPEARERACEPYFTTKPGGTGLGMAIVERIVDGHGGWISLEDRPPRGARVCLHIPWNPEEGP